MGVAYVGGEEEVVVGEFKVIAVSENRWLGGEDVVGSHSRGKLIVRPWVESSMGSSEIL